MGLGLCMLAAMRILLVPALVLLGFIGSAVSQQPSAARPPRSPGLLPYQNVRVERASRVEDLLQRLTPEEKISLLGMNSAAVPRLGIPAYHWWNEGLHGIARAGVATVFPQAIALAATWDTALHQKVADVISTEARAKNNAAMALSGGDTKIYQGLTIWSPNINIFRDPRWGRGQETYGEDPFLTGRFAVAFIHGLQGNDPHYLKTVATVKHFAVHSGPEESRHRFDAVISDRDLHETYLPAFEAGIREGGAKSLMSAYNAIDGIPAPANRFLLTDTLRTAWGFQGAVVGDVDTVADVYSPTGHRYAKDAAEASAVSLKAGNDLCSGTTYQSGLGEALKRGLITVNDLDIALRRLLRLRFELGQFDPPEAVKYRAISESVIGSPAATALARKAANESLVLLKNDGTLPWKASQIKTLAVLGPTADDESALLGNYNGTPTHPVTILRGLRARLEPLGIKVIYDSAVPLVAGFREKGLPIPQDVLFTDATKSTPGLKGEVFSNAAFTGAPIARRTDARVDLNWNPYEPAAGLPLTGVHARWTGILVPPANADYALSLSFIGSASLYVDDRLVAGESDQVDPGVLRSSSKNLQLEAGRAYRIRLEYHQRANDASGRIQLAWKPPSTIDQTFARLRDADHILLTLGVTPSLEGEESKLVIDGFSHGDRTSIQLPKVQQDLIARVAALHKPFTVVLTGSASLIFDVTKPNAILLAWYYGQSGGDAVADTLLGAVNPSGHLPVTFYRHDTDLPAFDDYAMSNRTYRYFKGEPLYPFGFGLSYTAFQFVDATVATKEVEPNGTIRISTTLRNTGKVAGDEVVQVYAHAVNAPVPMPKQWLVGFERVALKPAESRKVELTVPASALRRWDAATKNYVVDPGVYEFNIGQSSADAAQKVQVTVQR